MVAKNPCKCCKTIDAVDHSYTAWTCKSSGNVWPIYTDASDHIVYLPRIDKVKYPLVTPSFARWDYSIKAGATWHDLLEEEEAYEKSIQSDEQRKAEEAKKEAEAAAMLRAIEVGAEANHIRRVQEVQDKRYMARGKIAEPCKKLYSCVGGGVGGGMAKPTTMHVSSECWRYEYTDPETGKFCKVHSCNWLHPGEDGWQTEWETDRKFKPLIPIQIKGACAAAAAPAPALTLKEKRDGWQIAGSAPRKPTDKKRTAARR